MKGVALALALALAAGCHRAGDRGPGAPCDAVGAKFAIVARAELAAQKDLPADVAGGVDGLIAPMRDGMVRACKDDKWEAAPRDCFAGAADARGMKACYEQLTAAQRASLDLAAAGKTGDNADSTR